MALLVYAATFGHADRLPAIHAATIVSAVSAILSFVIIELGFLRGPSAMAGAFIAAWLLRSAVSIGGCVGAIVVLHLSPTVTLLAMTLYYLATLAAETAITVKRLNPVPQKI